MISGNHNPVRRLLQDATSAHPPNTFAEPLMGLGPCHYHHRWRVSGTEVGLGFMPLRSLMEEKSCSRPENAARFLFSVSNTMEFWFSP